VDLTRQYPEVEWNQESYGQLVLRAEEAKMLKVIRFKQINVQQMLNQTTVNINYSVDVPITAEDVLRHKDFATKAADRKVYGRRTYPWQINELQTLDEDQARRTDVNSVGIRNVRPRLTLEGPIRPPLRHEDLAYHYQESESEVSDEISVNEVEVMDLTGPEQDSETGILVVEALDPGISIARAINPTFQGNQLPQSYRDYCRMLESRLLAIERRSESYLTGELSDLQLRSVNDSLQAKLSRLFHPMLDNLHNDLQAFADQSMQKIEQRFGTWEKESESLMFRSMSIDSYLVPSYQRR